MNLLGIHLTLLIGGQEAPRPASPFIAENLRSVEVTQRAEGPSGFEMTFHVGRSSVIDLLDYRALNNPALKLFNRVVLLVRFAVAPVVVMDGIITNHQLNPSNDPGASTLTVTGEDISLLMDLKEGSQAFPAQFDYSIVTEIVGKYKTYGLNVSPVSPPEPKAFNPPNLQEEIPQKPMMTDRAFLHWLARDYGFLFYVTPGPAPGFSLVHWGPPERVKKQRDPLSVNMGPFSNVESLNFHQDGMRPHNVALNLNKRESTVTAPSPSRNVPLARDRAEPQRTVSLTCGDPRRMELRAQGMVDRSSEAAVTASGELDVLRYNRLLEPRSVVKVRGAGHTYDGAYDVKSVTHKISKGRYTQNFTLAREGTKPAS